MHLGSTYIKPWLCYQIIRQHFGKQWMKFLCSTSHSLRNKQLKSIATIWCLHCKNMKKNASTWFNMKDQNRNFIHLTTFERWRSVQFVKLNLQDTTLENCLINHSEVISTARFYISVGHLSKITPLWINRVASSLK